MASQRQQIQVGIVFILSIVILVVGIMWFRDFRIGGRYRQLDVHFPTASGLIKGDPVEARGVPAGEVEAIRFQDGRTVVTLSIKEGIDLHQGATVAIENVGIMGQKVIAIETGPPEAPLLPADATLTGTYQAGIPDLVSSLSGTFETFERLTVRIDSLLAAFDTGSGSKLMESLENTAKATDEMAGLISENRDELSRSIKSFSNSMASLERGLAGRENDISSFLESSASAASRLDSSLVVWERAVGRMDSLLAEARSGEGTLGRVVDDPALYDETLDAVRETRDLIRAIREDPGSFVKVSLF